MIKRKTSLFVTHVLTYSIMLLLQLLLTLTIFFRVGAMIGACWSKCDMNKPGYVLWNNSEWIPIRIIQLFPRFLLYF